MAKRGLPASIADMKPAPYNPREISAEAAAGLRESLARFGDLSGFVFNLTTGHIIAGHQRRVALGDNSGGEIAWERKDSNGERWGTIRSETGEAFRVRAVQWSLSKEKAANIAANRPTITGEFTDALQDVLSDVLAEMPEAFDVLAFADLLVAPARAARPRSTDDAPAVQENVIIRSGDVWTLGDHRLVCGDSTLPETWDLLGVENALLVVTDPPYGVSYKGSDGSRAAIKNDDLSGERLQQFLGGAMGHTFAATCAGAVWWVWAPPGPQFLDFAVVFSQLGVWRQTLAWVKNSLVLGHSDFHYKHESAFYGWTPGAAHNAPNDRKQVSVIECDRPAAAEDHPTMKPVDLIRYCVETSSEVGDVVIDPFLGSGTTLVVCEETGRRCHGIEFEPGYCDVIIRRWQTMTGKQAIRQDGKTFQDVRDCGVEG